MESQSLHDVLLRNAERLPRLSVAVQQLVKELSQSDVTVKKLASLVERDVVLAGYMLQISNSAAYGCRGRITSVGHAISIIGLERLRRLVTGLAVLNISSRITLPPEFDLTDFNRHSIMTAVAADALAQHVRVAYPEGAFLAGLLHDIGKLICASILPVKYCQVLDIVRRMGIPREQCEREILGFDHAQIGFEILTRWGLALPITRAILAHHAQQAEGTLSTDGVVPLLEVVKAADIFTRAVAEADAKATGALRANTIAELAPHLPQARYSAERFAETYLEQMDFMERDILSAYAH